MKHLLVLLLCLLLAGCSQPQAETPPEAAAVPEAPPVEEPAPEPEPEAPAPSIPDLETLPLYIYEGGTDKAVSPDGQVLLDTENRLTFLTDYNSGQIYGLVEQHQEGVVYDEYGWASPEKTWISLYDLEGRFLCDLPSSPLSAHGALLEIYTGDAGAASLYRISDGELLFEDVHRCMDLSQGFYITQGNWEAPGLFLNENGEVVGALPEELSIHSLQRDDQAAFLIVRNADGLYGLLDHRGREVLPCQYEELLSLSGGCAIIRTGETYAAVTLSTGETVFQWEYRILELFPESVLAYADEYGNAYTLLDRQAQPLLQEPFGWYREYDEDQDGVPELLFATTLSERGQQTLCFTPDGHILCRLSTDDGYLQPLTAQTALLTRSVWHEDTRTSEGWCYLVDLATGSQTTVSDGNFLHIVPLYDPITYEITPGGCFLVCETNAQGWSRYRLVNEQGQTLLENLSAAVYRGGGIFQVQQGFTAGLLRMDGTWLYRESRFTGLDGDR